MLKKLMSMANPFNAMKVSMQMMQNSQGKGSIGERFNAAQESFKQGFEVKDTPDIDFTKVEHDFQESTAEAKQKIQDGVQHTKDRINEGVQKMKDGASEQMEKMKESGQKFSHASEEAAKTFKKEYQEGTDGKPVETAQKGVYANNNGTALAILEEPQLSLPLTENTGGTPAALKEDGGFQNMGSTVYTGKNGGLAVIQEEPLKVETPQIQNTTVSQVEASVKKPDPLSAELAGFVKDINTNYVMQPGQNVPPMAKQYFEPVSLSDSDKQEVSRMSGAQFQGETRAFTDSTGSQIIIDNLDGSQGAHPLSGLFDGKEHSMMNIDARNQGGSYYAKAVPDNDNPGTVYLKGQGLSGDNWTGELKKVNRFGGEMYIINVYANDKSGYMNIVSMLRGNNEQIQLSAGKLQAKGS